MVMKKILLSFSFLLLLVACQSSSAINLSIKEESLTPDGLTLIIKNNSEQEYTYGDDYLLYVKEGYTWQLVDTILEDYGFDAIGHIASKNQSHEQVINWKWLYGSLNPGEYRLEKTFLDSNLEEFILSLEFKLN